MKSAPKRARLRLDSLVPHPKNYRQHPKTQLDALVASIKKFGQPRPILIRAANKQIIGGHGIAQALRLAGESEADCLVWDVDQPTADAYLIADNKTATLAHDDDDLLRQLMADVDAGDYQALGFTDEEVESLLDDKKDEDLVIKEIETGAVNDTFWLTVRGDLKHQAYALKRLQELMADLPGVEVELGSTPG